MSEVVSSVVGVQIEGHTFLRLSALDPLEKLLKANARRIKPGQFIIMEGEETDIVICVLSGWLSLSKCLPEGETQIVDFALPGEIIETGSAKETASTVSIEALTDASVAVIPALVWNDMKQQRSDLMRISRDLSVAARARGAGRMLRLGRGRAVMRLAYALLELNIRLAAIGQSKESRFHIPMNQRVLGDFVGLSSVHVCRTLGQLVDKEIIRVEGHMSIEILKPDLLAEMAGVDLETLPSEILSETDYLSSRSAPPVHA